jgi:SAM-dependent methyltransferase
MIEQAITRTSQLGLPLDFQAGSVFALPFDAASFNAVRIERTLQHLPDPAGAVAELVRVLRPGGRFAVLEPDWQTVVVAGGSREVLRAYLHQKAEVNAAQGAMGRDLPWLLSAAGCTITELIVEPVVFRDLASADFVLRLRGNLAGAVEAGAISHRAADGWWTVLEERDRAGAFLAFGNIVIVGADRR